MAKSFIRRTEQQQVDQQWEQQSLKVFADYELEQFHVKLENYNLLATAADLERFYIDVGAARRQYLPNKSLDWFMDSANPGHLAKERVDNKIEQWSIWRKKRFGTVQQLARLEKEAAAHTVTHHDDTTDFDLP